MEIVLSIIILLIIIYYIHKFIKIKYDKFSIEYNKSVQSDIDGHNYFVHTQHENMQVAANTFAELNKVTTDIIQYIYYKYKNSNNKKRKEIGELLMSRYDINSLRENSPRNAEKDTSYTINKGDIIAICIRSSKEHNQIHEIDIITFVVLHEITHLAINAFDHPEEFWEVFKFILIESEDSGLYTSPDFAKNPREYCGITINYNPRYDVFIKII